MNVGYFSIGAVKFISSVAISLDVQSSRYSSVFQFNRGEATFAAPDRHIRDHFTIVWDFISYLISNCTIGTLAVLCSMASCCRTACVKNKPTIHTTFILASRNVLAAANDRTNFQVEVAYRDFDLCTLWINKNKFTASCINRYFFGFTNQGMLGSRENMASAYPSNNKPSR
jgi:hypothetical protein